MAAGKVLIHIGHYGSGKTELSLNTALQMAKQGGAIALFDLDIVNPFFRSGEQKQLLEAGGVKIVAPLFVNTTVEIPALTAEVQSAFTGIYDCSILDVGGDPAGATALGRYHAQLEQADKWVRCIVNTCRPFTATAEDIATMARQMEAQGRVKIDSLVNCTNLADETTAATVLAGEPIVLEAARLLGVPMEFTAARRDLCDEVSRSSITAVVPVDIYIKPVWR
jgi:hypothetical protein